MSRLEDKILQERNFYRRRRNIIRHIFLILFVISFLFFWNKVFQVSKTIIPEVEIISNFLLNKSFIVEQINLQIKNKNFLLISPVQITKYLYSSIGLVKKILVRKYLFPKCKLFVIVKEKKIWATLSNSKNAFVTDEGDIVPAFYLNLNLLPKNLILIDSASTLGKPSLNILKRTYDTLSKRFSFFVSKFLINNKLEIEIYSKDNIRIKAGQLDNNLPVRVLKLEKILQLIKDHSYSIEYLDLTLDKGAIFKKQTDLKKKTSLFKKLRGD